jgi:hypothetical protein
MGGSIFTEGLTGLINSGSQSRFIGSQYSGLRANSLLLDVYIDPASSKSWDMAVLKEIFLNCNFRRRDADALQLVDNCRLWDLFCLSDFNAGVSVAMADALKPKTSPVEISAVVNFGFFGVGVDESVELLLTGKPVSIGDYDGIQIAAKWVYIYDESQKIYGYKSFSSVGGEQSYRDVQGIYYLGAPQEKNATVRDYTGSQTVNLRDAVAFANASGRFEFFTDFGCLYIDPTGLSQDVTVSIEGTEQLLLHQEFFSLKKLVEVDSRTMRDQELVLQAIYTGRPEKFDVLKQKGLVPSSFVPAR